MIRLRCARAGSRARTKTAACGAANRGFESHPARFRARTEPGSQSNNRNLSTHSQKLTRLRIGVRRIVIEVNRDLTVEQIEMLDETLKKLGLVKATKVTLHNDQQSHKVRPQRASHLNRLPAHGKYSDDASSDIKDAESA